MPAYGLLPESYSSAPDQTAMRNRELLPYRERVVSRAEGRVLEVGIGSGMNGRFYSDQVTEVVGIDAHPKLLTMMAREDLRVPLGLICATRTLFPWINAASIRSS